MSGTGAYCCQLAKNVFKAGKVITTVSTAKIPKVPELLGEGVVDQGMHNLAARCLSLTDFSTDNKTTQPSTIPNPILKRKSLPALLTSCSTLSAWPWTVCTSCVPRPVTWYPSQPLQAETTSSKPERCKSASRSDRFSMSLTLFAYGGPSAGM